MTENRPKILIIYTGGTIGMIENPVTKGLQPFDFTHLIDNVPKLKMLDYDIRNIQFDPPRQTGQSTVRPAGYTSRPLCCGRYTAYLFPAR